jgi:hypothetical protein
MRYGYIRVSTYGQAKDGNSVEYQERKLREAGAEEIYKDIFTGRKIERPQFDKLKEVVCSGDTIIVTRLDRFARSLVQASDMITKLIEHGVSIQVLGLGVLDNSSESTLFRNLLLSFAQFERDMIVERTQEGKAIARQKSGYHEGRPRIEKKRIDHAMELLEKESYKQVSEETGISKSTLIRERNRRKTLKNNE